MPEEAPGMGLLLTQIVNPFTMRTRKTDHPPKPNGCLKQLFKDKNNCYSMREIATFLFLVALITSWIATQFFNRDVPEYMFWSFATLIGAGCFGYSIEKKEQNW